MRSIMLGGVIKTISAIVAAVFLVITALAGDPQKMINAGADNVAIRGHNMVAYFAEGRPRIGDIPGVLAVDMRLKLG